MVKNTTAPSSTTKGGPAKTLSFWGFFAMTASMVMTVYEYPSFGSSGWSLIFFLLLGGIFWFLPVALCAAEMATVDGWQKGGLFTWVEKTLGPRWGLAAIFYQWFQITVGFVTMIYFIVGAWSIAFHWSDLNDNVVIKAIATLIIFWVITFSQLGGTKNTARLAKVGFFVGILAMGIIFFITSITYLAQGNPIQADFNAQPFIPDFGNLGTLVIFVSFILAYAGAESSASHVNEMKNPSRDYPLVMILLVIVAIILDALGGFTVGATIPEKYLGLNTGVIQSFEFLFGHFGISQVFVSIIAVIITIGVIAEIAAWVVGPSTALLDVAEKGMLPKTFTKVNKHGVPTHIVFVQGLVVSIWILILTFGAGSANLSFFVAMALTVCVYLVGYSLLFIGYIRKKVHLDDLHSAFRIKSKGFGIVIAVIGLILSVGAWAISFVPPSNFATDPSQERAYLIILIVCWVVMVIIPFIIYSAYGKKHYIGNPVHTDNHPAMQAFNEKKGLSPIPDNDAARAAHAARTATTSTDSTTEDPNNK